MKSEKTGTAWLDGKEEKREAKGAKGGTAPGYEVSGRPEWLGIGIGGESVQQRSLLSGSYSAGFFSEINLVIFSGSKEMY